MRIQFFLMAFLLICVFVNEANTESQNDFSLSPVNFVVSIANQIYAINISDLSEDAKRSKIQNIIEKVVDVGKITDFVLGRHIKNFDSVKKDRFRKTYINYLIKKYVKLLSSYNGKMEINGTKEIGNNRFSVLTSVQNNKKNKVSVSYSLIKNNDNSFLIYDVLFIDGISLSISDKDEINSFVEQNGVDNLITKLESK